MFSIIFVAQHDGAMVHENASRVAVLKNESNPLERGLGSCVQAGLVCAVGLNRCGLILSGVGGAVGWWGGFTYLKLGWQT